MFALLFSCAVLAAAPDAGVGSAKTQASLHIEGDGVKAASLPIEELKAMGAPVTADWSDKGGKHQVTGVRLEQVLTHQGFSEGAEGPKVDPKDKHAGLRAAVVATAGDGYQAVFSVGELLESVGSTQVLVVWELDGKPLEPKVGPLRLVVLNDKNHARSIFQLQKLTVVNLGKK